LTGAWEQKNNVPFCVGMAAATVAVVQASPSESVDDRNRWLLTRPRLGIA